MEKVVEKEVHESISQTQEPQVIPKNTPLNSNPKHLSVLSYNLLAPIFVRPIDLRTGQVQDFAAFEWAEPAEQVLDWQSRKPRLLHELTNSQADVICLQEVQFEPTSAVSSTYDLPEFLRLPGYEYRIPSQSELLQMAERNRKVLGVMSPTGNAVLWRSDRLKLAETKKHPKQGTTRVTVCLQSPASPSSSGKSNSALPTARTFHLPPTSFSSVHLDAKDESKRVKQLLQCVIISRKTYNVKDIIIAGDMNDELNCGSVVGRFDSCSPEPTPEQVFDAFCKSLRINTESNDGGESSHCDENSSNQQSSFLIGEDQQFLDWKLLHEETARMIGEYRVRFRRVPTGPTRSCFPHDKKEFPCVSWKLDHILFGARSLRLCSLWSTLEADLTSTDRGLPNLSCPSDHLPIAATFEPCEPSVGLPSDRLEHLRSQFTRIQDEQFDAWAKLESVLDKDLPLTAQTSTEKKNSKSKGQKPPPETIAQIQQRRLREREMKRSQLEKRRQFVVGLDLLELEQLDEFIVSNENCRNAMSRIAPGQAPASSWLEHGTDLSRKS